jgi:hypothetical protein
MENKPTAGVPKEEIAKYLRWYFPSLQRHTDRYAQLFFHESATVPNHLAYVCPMCILNGILILPNAEKPMFSSEFSQDHFPPKSVGGTYTMLVCKDCNNKAGGEIDFVLKDQLSRMSLENRTPLSQVKAVTTIEGIPGNYKGRFSINENGEAVLGFNQEGKKDAPYLNQWINEPGKNWEAKVTIRNPDEEKVAKALVRAAYLFCFGIWGYEFAFSRSAELIRRYLAGECEYPIRVPLAWLGSELNNVESIPAGVCQLLQPVEARCFLVNIVLVDQETGFREIAVVPIANPTDTGWEDLGNLKELFERLFLDKTPVTFNHADQYTLQQGVLDGYTKSWEYLRGQP